MIEVVDRTASPKSKARRSSIPRAGDGLRAEFSRFYESNYQDVYRAVYGYAGSSEVAKDATQEAFSRAWARWKRLRTHSWVGGWVTTTAINATRRAYRRLGVGPTYEKQLVASEPTGDRIDILRSLAKLAPKQRQAAVLHYIADCPVTAVAELMGIAEGTVKAHLAAARSTLKKHLVDYGSQEGDPGGERQ